MKTRRNTGNDAFDGCTHSARSIPASRFSGLLHLSWRDIFRGLGSPATRMHRYRDLHTRLLRESLCAIDCRDEEASGCADG